MAFLLGSAALAEPGALVVDGAVFWPSNSQPRWQSLARPWKTLYSTRSGFAWKGLDAVQILSLSSVVYLYQALAGRSL